MFFIRIIQGGGNTTRIKFDTDYKDVFQLFGDVVIDLLKDNFSIRKTIGFDGIDVTAYNDSVPVKDRFGIVLSNPMNEDFTDIGIC